MLILNAYFDDTGKEHDPNVRIVGIGGAVAPEKHWTRYEPEWEKVLKDYGVDYMHMKEFTQSVKQFESGWKDQSKRDSFLNDLWDVIAQVNPLFIGCFLPMQEYKTILTESERQALTDAFFIAYSSCVAAIQTHVFNSEHTQSVSMIFDENRGFKGVAHTYYDLLMDIDDGSLSRRIPSPVFRDMRVITQLQAADMIAYECAKEMSRRLYSPQYEPRLGFRRIQKLFDEKFGTPIEIGEQDMPIVFHPPAHIESVARALRTGKPMTRDEEFERFKALAAKVISVPKKELKEREKADQKQKDKPKNKGGKK